MNTSEFKYEYKGYRYKPEIEPDIDPGEPSTTYHWVITPKGEVVTLDWTSWSAQPTLEEFQMWIDLGLPKRIGCSPLDHEDLETIFKGRQ